VSASLRPHSLVPTSSSDLAPHPARVTAIAAVAAHDRNPRKARRTECLHPRPAGTAAFTTSLWPAPTFSVTERKRRGFRDLIARGDAGSRSGTLAASAIRQLRQRSEPDAPADSAFRNVLAMNSGRQIRRIRTGVRSEHPLGVALRAVVGPGDDAEPVVTVMLPEESVRHEAQEEPMT